MHNQMEIQYPRRERLDSKELGSNEVIRRTSEVAQEVEGPTCAKHDVMMGQLAALRAKYVCVVCRNG